MPAKGYTGITRRPPLRSDRGVKLYAPTIAKPCFRFVAAGQVEHERTGAPRAPRRELKVFFVASWLFALGNSTNVLPILRAQQKSQPLSHVVVAHAILNPIYSALSVPAGNLADRVVPRRCDPLGPRLSRTCPEPRACARVDPLGRLHRPDRQRVTCAGRRVHRARRRPPVPSASCRRSTAPASCSPRSSAEHCGARSLPRPPSTSARRAPWRPSWSCWTVASATPPDGAVPHDSNWYCTHP